MRVIGNIARSLRKVDPVGIPWAAVALWQAGIVVVVVVAIVQRAAAPLWTILAGVVAIIPGLYYRWSGRRISAVAAVPAFLVPAATMIWAHPVPFDAAPFILLFGMGAAAVHYSVAICVGTAAVGAAMLIGASMTHRLDGVAVYLSLLATALAVGYFVAIERDFKTAGLALTYRIDGQCELVTPSTGLGIYRICQESLANVIKHAPGVKADMDLQISPNSISLSIANDIPNPAPGTVHDAYGGAGLRGMKQRAQLLGGWLSAGLEQSRWTVNAQIPVSNQEPQSK